MQRHAPWRPEDWRRLDDWLYGVDLFNAFYFWEAHEAWEGLWAACDRHDDPAVLLQGLIQIAAALLKVHMRVLTGAHTLSRAGIGKIDRVRARHPVLLGLSLTTVADACRWYFAPLECNELPLLGPDVPRLRLSG
jgi:hypothetical protein